MTEKSPATDIAARVSQRLQTLLEDQIVGFYLYGASVFPDSQDMVKDVDFHVILKEPFSNEARRVVWELYRGENDGARRVGLGLDGYFLAVGDVGAATPPPHQLWPLSSVPCDESFALHCAHLRAGRGVALLGPDPHAVYPEPSWTEIRSALFAEIRFVQQVMGERAAYAVLNACRLLYSFTTHDVVISKRGAAEWVLRGAERSERELVQAAIDFRRGAKQNPPPAPEAARFVERVWGRIADLRQGAGA